MYHHHRLTIGGPGFDIMHIQRAAFIIIKRHIMRLKIIIGQIFETFIGGFASFHKSILPQDAQARNKIGIMYANFSAFFFYQHIDHDFKVFV